LKIKNILISQPSPGDAERSPYNELIKKHKVEIEFREFTRIEGITASEFRKDKVYIDQHSAIILASRNAVDHFFRIAKDLRVEVPESMKYFCTSEAIAYYLQKYVQYRKRKIFHGKQNFKDLLEIITKHKDEKYLLPCSDSGKPMIVKLLDESKINYSKAVIYRTLPADLKGLKIDKFDMIVFFSPAGVHSLFTNFPGYKQNSAVIGAFGQTTAKAVKDHKLKLDIAAPTKTALSMTLAIDQYLEKISRK
jgi:uroporphyrinogen-III synthase